MAPELPKHISYSQLTTMLDCGERYRLERLIGLPSRPGWATVGGTAVHEATEIIDKNPGAEVDYKLLFNECFDRAIQHDLERYQDSPFTKDDWRASGRASKQWPDKEDEKWWRQNGPLFVANWVNWCSQSPLTIYAVNDEPAIELDLEMELAGTPLRVVIDRLMVGSYGVVVVDIKSGAFAPKSPRQLAVYAEALDQAIGIRPRWGQYFDARKGVSSVSYDLKDWTRARLDYEFGGVRRIQEQGIFIASPGNMCSSCGVKDYCLTMGGSRAHEVEQPWES
jgi:hypothetical protein